MEKFDSDAFVRRLADRLRVGYDHLARALAEEEIWLNVKQPKPDWWGDPEDQIVEDCVREVLYDSEGRPSGKDIKAQFANAGLRLVPIVETGMLGDLKTFREALGAVYVKHTDQLIDVELIEAALTAAGLTVIPAERDRGDGRTAHYGADPTVEQPWDTSKRVGWAAVGACFSILRYLRRTKQPERDLKAAKVYYAWLFELARMDKGDLAQAPRTDTLNALREHRKLVCQVLTQAELSRLGVPAENVSY